MAFLNETGLEHLWAHIVQKLGNKNTVGADITLDQLVAGTINTTIPTSLLPSYVDDVIEYDTFNSFPVEGEVSKIYIAIDTNKTYRWSGTGYTEISASLALGETNATAFRGDQGKEAYDHKYTKGNPHETSLSDLGVTVSSSEINYLSGITSNIKNQLTSINSQLVSMSGATASTAGTTGFVPAPAAGDNLRFLRGDGSWADASQIYVQKTEPAGVGEGTLWVDTSGTTSLIVEE